MKNMQIILLDKSTGLGDFSALVTVKAGYARNFLIPQGKAVKATRENIKYFENKKHKLEVELSALYIRALEKIKNIDNLKSITIYVKTGKNGKLFGSVGASDIANALANFGIEVLKREIRLSNRSIRYTGEYNVKIQIYKDCYTYLMVCVVGKNIN